MSSLGDTLRSTFLTGENRIEWRDLGGALAGVFTFRLFEGAISLPLGIANGIAAVFEPITGAYRAGGDLLASTLTSETAAAFGTVDFGVFSFPVSALVILLSTTIIVFGFDRVVFDE